MAEKGRPLPWLLREAIKERAELGHSRRAIARQLGLAKRTVDKYARTSVAQNY